MEDEGVACADFMTELGKACKKMENCQREALSGYSLMSSSSESKEEEGRPLLFQKTE